MRGKVDKLENRKKNVDIFDCFTPLWGLARCVYVERKDLKENGTDCGKLQGLARCVYVEREKR